MSGDKSSHDFNWVKARHKCSVYKEFVNLKSDLESFVAEREKLLSRGSALSFSYHNEKFTLDENECSVQRGCNQKQEAKVSFTLDEEKDCILVNKKTEFTLTLNDDGECRYQIDGKGEFLRWQVIRRVLEPLLWPLAG